ncbi:MAG: GDYXXLXY domain-containing protein [Bosea sp. (in: a-proteobacteria)]
MMGQEALGAAYRLIGRVPALARTGLAALVLCGLVLAMVIERAAILRDGATIRLATVPVDPRDLFRGDYVVLNYEISTINLTRIGAAADLRRDEPIQVGVRAGVNGQAEVVRVVRAGQPREPGLIWLGSKAGSMMNCFRGFVGASCSEGDKVMRVRYGLESYFVPQGEGRAIETTQASRVEILATVSTSGASAIKALLIDGKPVYNEPPY